MTDPRRAALSLGVGAAIALACGLAAADALEPPPKSCPEGQVGVTGRQGARCVPEAPASCPNGLRPTTGYEGPSCRPWLCASDSQCGEGASCVEQEVCLVPSGGTPGPSDEPRDLCDAGGRCEAPAHCGPARVCIKAGVAPGVAVPVPAARKSGSCKGCTSARSTARVDAAALSGIALAVAVMRARRRLPRKST